MTSRRSMARSYSSNGRAGSQNGEDVPSPRLDSRNYLSNVRPENRSTFCTVMAQLTEETQPCFETTIKSKAVSEASNVKFSCVVTGYPVPELTWYKDDMELDRYCGLPKYEIFRNGKTHTLHIYNCTVEDAAIYQASARNSKGIVSCSGVLEVGAMSEYKIHQKFFAKLKQKADLKRREVEESRRRGKENNQLEQLGIMQERILRKRRLSEGQELNSLSGVNNEVSDRATGEEKPAVEDEELNGLSAEMHEPKSSRSQENDTQHVSHVRKKEESSAKQATKEKVSKKIMIPNGFDQAVNNQPNQDSGGVETSGGMSLTKYLAESLQSHTAEEQQTIQESKIIGTIQEKEKETEGEWMKMEERERVRERSRERKEAERLQGREREKVRQLELEHEAASVSEAQAAAHRELEHQHKSAFSTVFHSLKDIFFGKGKKSPETVDDTKKNSSRHAEKEMTLTEQDSHNAPLQTKQGKDAALGVCGEASERSDQPHQTGDLYTYSVATLQSSPTSQHEMLCVDLADRTAEFITDDPQMLLTDETHYNAKVRSSQEQEARDAPSKTPSLQLTEASDTESSPIENVVNVPYKKMDLLSPAGGEMYAAVERDFTTPNLTDLKRTGSFTEADLSQSARQTSLLVPIGLKNEEEQSVESCSKQSVQKMQEFFINENEGKDEVNVAAEGAVDPAENPETVAITGESALSLYETRQESDRNVGDELSTEPQVKSVQERKHSIPTVMTSLVEDDQQVGEAVKIDGYRISAEHDAKMDDSTEKSIKHCVEEDMDKSTEEKKSNVIEKNKGGNWTGENVHISLDQAALSTTVQADISEHTRQSDVEGIQTHLSPNTVDKSKTYTKGQTERYMGESKDQSVTPPMIILPDTRETVIKNVAKMRATPLIPEIKVTATISVPRIDALVSEPERVLQPLAQEVAHIFRDNEPTDDAKRAPSEVTRDNKEVSDEQPGSITPTQQQRAPSNQRNQDLQNQEAAASHREDQVKITSGWNRGNDISSIPIISIACADDVTTSQEGQVPIIQDLSDSVSPKLQVYTLPTLLPADKENSTPNDMSPDSLTAIFKKAEGDLNHVGLANKSPGTEKSDKRNVETQISTDALSPFSTKINDVEPDADRLQRDKPAMEKLGLMAPVGPMLPPLSPASLRRLMAKNNPNLESQSSIPAISSDGSEKKGEESGGSTPTSTLSCESSPKMKRRDSLTLIPSATPEELASGARRKIYLAKTKSEDEGLETQNKRDSPKMSPSQARRAAFLQLQSGQQTPPMERRSPLLGRRKATLDVPKPKEETSEETENSNTESKPAEKEKLDPFKAPQVIRKIRGEAFSDASGHLKLWCQFFNVLSDSTIKWFKDEEQIVQMTRSAGDESQVALAIVQASSKDCGVYGCTIQNEYGTDTTDYLLSEDILAEFFLRDDSEVGEEIEMTPMLFTKGLADPGYWGEKFFGRIMTEEVQIGEGCTHKASRAKVIYGLEPIFESGGTCVVKVRNPIAYGTKEESNLSERNLEITKQECKIQNTVREYCRIFAAEARVIDNFGSPLEVIPLYLMYRPANTIPYATVEADLKGVLLKHCLMDNTGRMVSQTSSEVEQKCCAFQHWIHQWTNGNLLVIRLEGVETKITNIRIATKSKGYQNLTDEDSPKVLEQFVTQHQCNYYCGLLGLRPLKLVDSLPQPKGKTSRSPLLTRRAGSGSSSPQIQKKGMSSPQTARKGNSSPKVAKKTGEDGENQPANKHKTVEVPKTVRMR